MKLHTRYFKKRSSKGHYMHKDDYVKLNISIIDKTNQISYIYPDVYVQKSIYI